MQRSPTPPDSAAAKVRQSDGLVPWRDRQAEILQILAILHKWGIHTLGELAALDKEQLGVRLGLEAIRMWERANGQSDRPLKLIRPLACSRSLGVAVTAPRNDAQTNARWYHACIYTLD